MRPVPETGNSASRGPSHPGPDDLSSNSAVQSMTYFMATEESLDRAGARSFQSSHSHPYMYRHAQKSDADSRSGVAKGHHQQHQSSMSETTSVSWPSPSLASQQGIDTPPLDLSRPMTPVLIDHCPTESATSCLSSPRSSLAASPIFPTINDSFINMNMNQTQSSHNGTGQHPSTTHVQNAAIPQFIMPSVAIPRRRPFSDAGKSLGKLKILVAGQAGLGKSSLISSIAQSCDHIVHMDPVMTSQQQHGAAEIYASTRPCPWWQAEMEPSNLLLKRRSSSTDEILDRNVCFVDCSAVQKSVGKHSAVGYVESQLSSLLTRPINDGDLWKLLSSGAEPIVDAVLYLLPPTGPGSVDIATLKALQSTTNIIPLLARADELVDDQVSDSQRQMQKLLENQDIDCFSFTIPGADHAVSDIYAISNLYESDHDVMDASVLMNSEFQRPLISSDLQRLVEDLLSPDGCARLRHSASLKCVSWRRQQNQSLSSALTRQTPGAANGPPPATIGNLYMQHQYWRRVEMGSWAESLRQSLAAERRGETPSLLPSGEMVSSMPVARIERTERYKRHGKCKRKDEIPRHQDPLGLLGFAGQLKCNSKQTVELFSSVGLLGYLATQLGGDGGILPKW